MCVLHSIVYSYRIQRECEIVEKTGKSQGSRIDKTEQAEKTVKTLSWKHDWLAIIGIARQLDGMGQGQELKRKENHELKGISPLTAL